MLTQGEDVEVHVLARRGWSVSAIARHLGRDRKTVRAYLTGQRQPGRRTAARPDPLAPFAAYLCARFTDDPHIWATALYDEVVPLGYGCSYVSFARQLRLAGGSSMCAPGRSVSSPGCLRRSPLLRRSSSPAHCWITRAVSAIRCVMNTPGSIPPAAGLTGACVIGSTRTATRWSSWTFLTDPTPMAHERSAPVAGNWPLYRLIAGWSLRVAGSTPERTHADPQLCSAGRLTTVPPYLTQKRCSVR